MRRPLGRGSNKRTLGLTPLRSPPARGGEVVLSVSAALALSLLGGCGVDPGHLIGGFGAGEVASITILHRGLFDTVYSGLTGKDCSIVRLDEGKSYCRPPEPPPPLEPYCTRSLGVVDCWQSPALLPDQPPQVGDTPAMTSEQIKNANKRWPPL